MLPTGASLADDALQTASGRQEGGMRRNIGVEHRRSVIADYDFGLCINGSSLMRM
jgi:hypothetical protein